MTAPRKMTKTRAIALAKEIGPRLDAIEAEFMALTATKARPTVASLQALLKKLCAIWADITPLLTFITGLPFVPSAVASVLSKASRLMELACPLSGG